MSLMKELIKGKVKTVYAVDDVERVMIMYHDKVTAGNGEKEDHPVGKGEINCAISTELFKLIKGLSIRTHHIATVGPTMLCHKVDIIPIEVVVRNIAAGSIVRQTTIEEGTVFETPLIEFYLKDDDNSRNGNYKHLVIMMMTSVREQSRNHHHCQLIVARDENGKRWLSRCGCEW